MKHIYVRRQVSEGVKVDRGAETVSVVAGVSVVMIMQCLRVDMSMMLKWHANVTAECDRRRTRLPDASLQHYIRYQQNRAIAL